MEDEDRVACVVRDAWSKELELTDFSDDDDFFALGGHSLVMANIQTSLAEQLGIEVPMDELFRRPTVARMSAYIAGTGRTS